MYRSSDEHLFAQLLRIRQRATKLLHGDKVDASPDLDDTAAEALALASSVELRLPAITSAFSLSPLARQTLLCLTAAEFDPFIRTVIRALQREHGRPWLEIGTIAELLDLPLERVPELIAELSIRSPLQRYALVLTDDVFETPSVSTRVKVNGRTGQYLVGKDDLPEYIERIAPTFRLSSSLVKEEAWHAIVDRARHAEAEHSPLLVEVYGPTGTGKRAFAEGLASELDVPLLLVDLSTADPKSLGHRLAEGRRERQLAGALLCLARWDKACATAPVTDENGQAQPTTLQRLPDVLERFLDEEQGLLVLTAEEREPLLLQHATALSSVAVPFPSPSQRAALMQAALDQRGYTLEGEVDLAVLMRRFALDPGRIDVASRAAAELVEARRPGSRAVSYADLQEACRHQLRHDLKSLAHRVTNSHRWEDLVIPVDVYHSLREMVSYIRHAERVYDGWGFGARHSLQQGVSALFAGPPGTGKTMCASVMARELDMELFRVDLSRVVSKWIGETEKNLGKVFDEAQRSNAIILFDEADSLFAKRTEVKSSVDRYANLEINFLLQRMEVFSGVTILTTNFEDTLDTAFKRRLTFRMRFEKPDGEARAALWKKVFPASAALSDDLDFDRLGALYELAGGNIRNAAVRAAFLAAAGEHAIDMKSCMLAAEREAREMGVLIRSAVEGDGGAAPADAAAEPEPRSSGLPSPRLVPISHPRDRG